MRCSPAAFAAAALLLSIGSNSARANLRAQLKAGQIVAISVGSSGVVPGRAMGLVEAPADKVFQIITDLAQYPHFVPRIKESRHLHDNVYELLAKLPWPVSDARVKLKIRTGQRGKTYVMSWKMAEGTLEKYEGTAWVQPWGDKRCLLTYQMLAVPRIPAPSSLMNRGLRNAVTKVVSAVRERARDKLAARPWSPQP